MKPLIVTGIAVKKNGPPFYGGPIHTFFLSNLNVVEILSMTGLEVKEISSGQKK
jgi:hypothetical protein